MRSWLHGILKLVSDLVGWLEARPNERVGIYVVIGFCEAFGDFHNIALVILVVNVYIKADILEIHISRVMGFSYSSYLVC